MSTSKTLALSSLAIHRTLRISPSLQFPFSRRRPTFPLHGRKILGHSFSTNVALESSEDLVEQILTKADRVDRLMKMQRGREPVLDMKETAETGVGTRRWFPYLDLFKSGEMEISSKEVIDVLDYYIMDSRKERFQRAVENRTYSLCLVVEGLTDFGNVSAAFRSADALGIQSVHVISCDKKRYRDNRHVSMGAEKWLDIELWDSPAICFRALRNRGYRIATTHLGPDSVSVYDLDWSQPTAIVVGNELMGISEVALRHSDLHCSIPMKGMIDSFNVSVAAGILMHHAVCDRSARVGKSGDLTPEESQILLAEFYLRHKTSTANILHEYVSRKSNELASKL
ncbi:hypothetical protein LUZ60_006511 [Juncus effusus]|nr:hypothetical protein LUZ60_006511 [Juncus effusus]